MSCGIHPLLWTADSPTFIITLGSMPNLCLPFRGGAGKFDVMTELNSGCKTVELQQVKLEKSPISSQHINGDQVNSKR